MSLRDIELTLAERGAILLLKSIRRWCRKFGQQFANSRRRRRRKPGDMGDLDQVFLPPDGEQHYPWCAVASAKWGRVERTLAPGGRWRRIGRPSHSSARPYFFVSTGRCFTAGFSLLPGTLCQRHQTVTCLAEAETREQGAHAALCELHAVSGFDHLGLVGPSPADNSMLGQVRTGTDEGSNLGPSLGR